MDDIASVSTSEIVEQAFNQAPAHIRNFITSGKYETFTLALHEELNLHADTEGSVSDEVLMMLLGMSTPQEFPGHLRELGLDDAQTSRILQLANEEIFVPLQESLRADQSAPQVKLAPVAPAVPVPSISSPRPVSPPSLQTTAPMQAPVPASITPPTPAPIIPSEPKIRTMAHDVESLSEGTTHAPQQAPVVASAPTPVAPRSNDPLAAPVIAPKEPEPQHTVVVEELKKYGIDPYRETVD